MVMGKMIRVLKVSAAVLAVPVAILFVQPAESAEAEGVKRISDDAWLASGSCLALAGYLYATRRRPGDSA